MKLNNLLIIYISILLTGCTLDFTVHDEDKAAELTQEYFQKLRTEDGIQAAYDNSHQEFKNVVNKEQYALNMKQLYTMIDKYVITLSAYETYGTEEAIAIYAIAKKNEKKMYFKVTFRGTMSKGYNVLNFNVNDQGYKASGIFKEFSNPIEFKI